MSIKKEWSFVGKSDVGIVRTENQDNFKIISTEKDLFLILADGMGGHYGGLIAAEIAVRSCVDKFIEYKNQESQDILNIKEIMTYANQNIIKHSIKKNFGQKMGTTILIFHAKKEEDIWNIHWNSIGDSSLYQIKENKITKLSKDHSLVQKLIDMGEIKKKDAKDFPYKNVLYKSLGTKPLSLDETQEDSPDSKDIYLLCSDGLTTHVEENEIQKIICKNKDNLNKGVEELIDLSKERGGTDNITIVIAQFNKDKDNLLAKKNTKKNSWALIAYILIFLLIMVFIFLIFS